MRIERMQSRNPTPTSLLMEMSSVIVIIILTFLCQMSQECPTVCECKWKSGKESAICANLKNKLTSIPAGLDPGTQVLDLSKNNIQALNSNVFFNQNILNLQKIFLSNCNLKTLERNVFYKLTNLVELDLSTNKLETVPTHTFDQIPELRELNLNFNPIYRIPNNAFNNLTNLVRLELSGCKIKFIDSSAFRGLATLEWLKLDNNKLQSVQASSFYPLRNLHGLQVHGNPWNCSCALQPLREWMTTNNVPFGVPPVCSQPPRLEGKSWEQLQILDFACLPQLSSLSGNGNIKNLQKVVEGENATLVCQFHATTDTQVRWMNGNKPVSTSSHTVTSESFQPDEKDVTFRSLLNVYHIKQTIGTKESKLTLIKTTLRDSGVYSCSAETRAGSMSKNFTLLVLQTNVQMSGQYLAYGAMVASLLMFSMCVLLAIVYFYGHHKSRILIEEKMELNHINQNGRSPGNPHNGSATTVPLLQNGDHSPNVNHNSNSPINTNRHEANGYASHKMYKPLYNIAPTPVSSGGLSNLYYNRNPQQSSHNNPTNTNGNNNMRKVNKNNSYKVLPSSDLGCGRDSSSELENDLNDSDDEILLQNKEGSPNAIPNTSPLSPTPRNEKEIVNLKIRNQESPHHQKYPDLINGQKEGLQPQNVIRRQLPIPNHTFDSLYRRPLAPMSSPPASKIPIPSTNATPVRQLPTHRRSNSDTESSPSHRNSSATCTPSHLRTPNCGPQYGSTFSPRKRVLPPLYTNSRSRTSSGNKLFLSHRHLVNSTNSSSPNYISRTPNKIPNLNQYRNGNHFERRSMPSSPVHYNSGQYYSHAQTSDPCLVPDSDYGYQDLAPQAQEYDLHAAQLTAFLEDYHALQMELMRMNASLSELEVGSKSNPNSGLNTNRSNESQGNVNSQNSSTSVSHAELNTQSTERLLDNSIPNSYPSHNRQRQILKSILKSPVNNNYLV